MMMSPSDASNRCEAIFLAFARPFLLLFEVGGPAAGDGAGAVSAHAELHLVGVAMDDLHLADGNAEALRDQLRKRRLMALAMAVRTGQDFDGADRIDPDLRGFPQTDAGAQAANCFRGRDAAGLDVAGEADAAEFSFRLRLGLARGEAGVVDRL